ncbi:SDR family NAD(P)-dependent oxidoreductase [Treponema sp. Marseille-Q4130]|uniref:SDR family NAD(P)-dependent oxidoreductase n=1 Tax=Treponema sp. Marseille-Q4130 TaxID=2766702 RepID=UPI0016521F73|nr:glucose 1-dehydrogenase [Treponema sp. Marseille-Q4130]MBC6721242.1 glucose 1-dehydrogenase [Treponema sp. Marseille-Q4130]
MSVSGKTILITGGAGGLGFAMTEVLLKNKANVVMLDVAADVGDKKLEELKRTGYEAVSFMQTDVTKEEDWKRVVDASVERYGRIDVLVNNAGINIRKPIEEMNISEWNTMMSVNTGSVFLGCKYVIPIMKKQGGGAIINTSSVCGLIGHKYTPEAYTASKGAVTLLTKAIASRYAQFGIRCNSIHPSTVDTPLVQTLFKDPARKAERLGEVPLGRLCSAQDVANAVLFLSGDDASFINGLAMTVDGGVTCY